MPFVIDASVTMAWCFADEASPAADAVLERLRHDEAIVPSLWRLEVTNVVLGAERRQRLTEAQGTRFLELLGQLPIRVDPDLTETAPVLDVGRRHGLSAYDACYLALAQRLGVAVATLDTNLARAARAAGVEVLTDPDSE
jgi:predicted nucleic acid-binding protein